MTWLEQLRNSRFPILAISVLLVLLVAGLLISVASERAIREQMAREAGAQADLLASAVSGALAFGDRAAAQDYVDAVQVNPNVLAAAVYDERNRLVASFARPGQDIPAVARPRDHATTLFRDGRLIVVRPVEQGGQRLGTARLRLMDDPPMQRFMRYASLILVLALGALAVGILAVAQTALMRANRELADQAQALRDQIRDREKAEEALRQSQKMEAIGRLTGGIAHDFNNLLMVASSGIELLERTTDPERRRKLSEGVRQAVARGAALTSQLLAFSRQAPMKSAVLDLRGQIEGLRFMLERSLREDIALVIDIPGDLWPVEADAGELELALLNLAINARDAMPEGGTFTLSARNLAGSAETPDAVRLEITDTGVGIPEATLSRVFEPFFTTKEVGRGTGLGLSQVYGFARSSGGSVEVRSQPGAGTTFAITLPRTRKAPPPAPAPSAGASDRESGGAAVRRVLLVEDDDGVADSVGQMLERLGLDHVRAETAPAALALFEADPAFDLVVSDMVMPGGMDGLTLARTLHDRAPTLPILLTTGYSAAAAAAGSEFPLLLKPYRLEDLDQALRTVAAGRGA
ncbi:MAG: ATP-binding protein [Caulobacter sp.]|nr:ATP-binding protein [Caulobacter sp.]